MLSTSLTPTIPHNETKEGPDLNRHAKNEQVKSIQPNDSQNNTGHRNVILDSENPELKPEAKQNQKKEDKQKRNIIKEPSHPSHSRRVQTILPLVGTGYFSS